MKPLSITEIVSATGGQLIGRDAGELVGAVSTDTRNLPAGCLFVALRGDHFDGHDFAARAAETGAGCLMLEELPEGGVDLGVPAVLVENTLYGLQRLALWYRQQLDIRVVAITGSNGKTSTKDFAASVLAQQFKVNATKGNLNNHIGLPLSVLSAEETDQVAVWEMGMNHAGEIAPLCEIAAPDLGIITSVGTAHIEFLGSREGIAEEKSALARALPDSGALILPASCEFDEYMMKRTHAKVIIAGNGRGVVRAENLKMTETGSAFNLCINGFDEVPVEIAVNGKHMVSNALLAASAGYALGMNVEQIAAGLNAATLTSGRLRRYVSQGVTVIDDTYNSNPDSAEAAIETLADFPVVDGSRRVCVFGMMAELGTHADAEHLRIGKLAAEKNLQVVSVGAAAVKISQGAHEVNDTAQHFDDAAAAADWLKDYCRGGDNVLFKGSRMASMENVMHRAFPID
ncbi:MAG: UDP-N-acetylmuramoyl-tripeptide--D-alanyl-D-alanine ligase [Verrucomicrobiae bacterium]|nr:UDP-N-acetylmuramoyl-tripeptide--D-alanyl-D-alanine ligase [Verrucomicrobiae bacterium]NNJ43958.1 UDP-N-acetylmuramoyl-tripeptide--D-alanyl-D-alanine ligase [Akkermansiaceae bacterium]